MPQLSLEKRVATLEKQVSELLAAQTGKKRVKDWRRTFGAFTGDDVMKEIFEEGRKIREAERKRARAPGKKKPQARS
jgi:hypothetical protein